MIVAVIRVLVAFMIACLAASATLVVFVMTTDLITAEVDRLGSAGLLVLYMATIAALFASPFALVAAVVGEWQAIRNWAFYALAGLAIAIAGFIAQYSTEAAGQPSIVNNYALAAFLASGLAGGCIYWLLAGRYAGRFVDFDEDEEEEDEDDVRKTPAPRSTTPAAPNLKKV